MLYLVRYRQKLCKTPKHDQILMFPNWNLFYAMLISKLEDSLVVSDPDKSNHLLCMAIRELVNDSSSDVNHLNLNAIGTHLAFIA